MDGLGDLRIAYFPEPHVCKFSWAFYTLTDVVPFQDFPLQIERKTPAHSPDYQAFRRLRKAVEDKRKQDACDPPEEQGGEHGEKR